MGRNVIVESSSDASDGSGDDGDHTAKTAPPCTYSTDEAMINTYGMGSSSESPSSQKINDDGKRIEFAQMQ
jgi:hypothetical protein